MTRKQAESALITHHQGKVTVWWWRPAAGVPCSHLKQKRHTCAVSAANNYYRQRKGGCYKEAAAAAAAAAVSRGCTAVILGC